MQDGKNAKPDSTATRVALWRALHVAVDAPPHVLKDEIGLRLLAPQDEWRQRPDMDPRGTSRFRASIVARARFIEDLVVERIEQGVRQYVLLGAGLDSFAQRRPDVASKLRVFEIDQPGTQEWKQQRLIELSYGIPEWLRFVPVDFEAGQNWQDQLTAAGFDTGQPAIVASTGVSLYLTRAAIAVMLRLAAKLVPGSTLAMTYILPLDIADEEERPGYKAAARGAQASGTPFLTYFTPEEMLAMAREAGFREVMRVSGATLAERYFSVADRWPSPRLGGTAGRDDLT